MPFPMTLVVWCHLRYVQSCVMFNLLLLLTEKSSSEKSCSKGLSTCSPEGPTKAYLGYDKPETLTLRRHFTGMEITNASINTPHYMHDSFIWKTCYCEHILMGQRWLVSQGPTVYKSGLNFKLVFVLICIKEVHYQYFRDRKFTESRNLWTHTEHQSLAIDTASAYNIDNSVFWR